MARLYEDLCCTIINRKFSIGIKILNTFDINGDDEWYDTCPDFIIPFTPYVDE